MRHSRKKANTIIMAGPSSLVVNLRFNPPEIEIVGPVLESTVLKLGSLLPRMTSLSRNRARKELPQFQKEVLVGVSLSSNNIATNANPLLSWNANGGTNNNNNSNQTSNPTSSSSLLSKSQQQQQQQQSTGGYNSNNNKNSGLNINNNSNTSTSSTTGSSSSPVVWKLELPFSMAGEVAQMQMMHAIVECIDEEGIWDMRGATSFTTKDEGVDYTTLFFVKKPKRKEV